MKHSCSQAPCRQQVIRITVPIGSWDSAEKLVRRLTRAAEESGCHFAATYTERPVVAGHGRLTNIPYYEPAHIYEIRTNLAAGNSKFELVGTLDHMANEGQVLIRALGDHQIPEAFRDDDGGCDHCCKRRRRRTTYLLKNRAGRLMRVGSSCLLEFLGPESAELLRWRWELHELAERRDDESNPVQRSHRTEDIIALINAVTLRHGSVPISEASTGKTPTRDLICALLIDQIPSGWTQDDIDDVEIQDTHGTILGDHAVARKVIAWAETVRPRNHFMHRMQAACLHDETPQQLVGILVAAVASFKRAERQSIYAKASNPRNEPCGSPGGPIDTSGVLLRCSPADGPYGLVYVCQLQDTHGYQLKWFSDKPMPMGVRLRLKGEIKRIDIYRGIISTVVHHEKIAPLESTH